MYSKIGNDFCDQELNYLIELLSIIDKVVCDIHLRIKTSVDPESDGLFDKGEYFIGAGFCVMQRYLSDVLHDKKITKVTALQLGPKTAEGLPISILINSAANFWKHSPEWHLWMTELDERSQKTINNLINHDNESYYPLSEVLESLCIDGEFSLLSCIPFLTKWREAVNEKIKNID